MNCFPNNKIRKNKHPGFSKNDIIQLIHRHAEFTPRILKQIEQIEDSILRNLASKKARQINRMIHQIFKDFERTRQFTRTKLNDHGILYGIIQITHKIEDWVLDYFTQRFPKCWICLFNETKQEVIVQKQKGMHFVYNGKLSEIVNNLSKERPLNPYFQDIKIETEELFEEFYISQYIPTRKNRRYFQQVIPLKDRKLPGLRDGVETRFLNHGLEKYMHSPQKTDQQSKKK